MTAHVHQIHSGTCNLQVILLNPVSSHHTDLMKSFAIHIYEVIDFIQDFVLLIYKLSLFSVLSFTFHPKYVIENTICILAIYSYNVLALSYNFYYAFVLRGERYFDQSYDVNT